MRWLLLTDGMSPFELGGMQKHSSNLLKELLKWGDEVDVAHCVSSNKTFFTQEEVMDRLAIPSSSKCTIKQFTFPKLGVLPGHYLKESYSYSVSLFQYYQKQELVWDVVFAQGFTGWKFIEERKKGNWSVPVINHFHGLEMFQSTTGWKEKIQQWMFRSPVRWNLRNADFTISLGGKINQILFDQGIKKDNIIDLPVAIHADWLRQEERKVQRPLSLLFVGRFEARKGLKNLLSAFMEWNKNERDVKLTIVGNIPPTQRVKHPHIFFEGVVHEEEKMKEIMDNHDVLVVPSYSEGMPTVILEAMARKMAVMCTKVGATEVMVGDENGLLLDSPSTCDIIKGLDRIAAWTKEEIKEKGMCGWNKVKVNWVWDQVMNEWRPRIIKQFLKK
jgi:glycosyltransferase involved in cell wall biosynthesis